MRPFCLLYLQDGTYLQKLIQPTNEAGQKRTVQDLLDDFGTPDVRKAGKKSDYDFCPNRFF